jgi:hypothetical protein
MTPGAPVKARLTEGADSLAESAPSGAAQHLELQPITLEEANEFVRQLHRHAVPVLSWKFGVGVTDGKRVVGVGIAGRPIARAFDDGWTIELTRVCTDGARNGCSILYGALTRAALALGYRRVITYTKASESGSSLRAAGFRVIAERPARSGWNAPGQPRVASAADREALRLWESSNGGRASDA